MNDKIKKDLNDMVVDIRLVPNKGRYGDKVTCEVKLYNNVVIEFKDDGLFDLLAACKKTGTLEEVLKSRKLVEEEKNDSVIGSEADEATGTYYCVLYKLVINGINRDYRLFLKRPQTDKPAIDIYYDGFKKLQRQKAQQGQSK